MFLCVSGTKGLNSGRNHAIFERKHAVLRDSATSGTYCDIKASPNRFLEKEWKNDITKHEVGKSTKITRPMKFYLKHRGRYKAYLFQGSMN